MAIHHGLDESLPSWDEVRATTQFTGILLGNGASRAVWDGFGYESLYNIALTENQNHPLSPEDAALFEALNTRNFENVLAGLATTRRVAAALGLEIPVVTERYASIQSAVAEAVRQTHIPWMSVPDVTLTAIRNELRTYRFVYSTNYDLLVYWTLMHAGEGSFKDFFWTAPPYFDLANTEVWEEPTLVLYLHGGLHLYRTVMGRTVKRSGEYGTNLLELFGTPFVTTVGEDATPLFVSEGSPADKLDSIRRSDYLGFSYTKLTEHEGPLCVFGHSLSDLDDHIVKALQQSKVSLAISIRPGPPMTVIERKALAIAKFPAGVRFFDATTHPLGNAGLKVHPNPFGPA
jgi:Domain of unknown function (DUF4917)